MVENKRKPEVRMDELCEIGKEYWINNIIALFSIGYTDDDIHYDLWEQHKNTCEQCKKASTLEEE